MPVCSTKLPLRCSKCSWIRYQRTPVRSFPGTRGRDDRRGDDAGRTLRTALERDGVDTSAVLTTGAPSGIAFITVAPDGEIMIVVSPGANARVSADDVQRHAALLQSATVVLLQLEIPDDAVLAAATLAGGLVVLNPAPARPLSRTLLDHVDICVPNEHELAILTGQPVPSTDDLETLSQRLPIPTVVAISERRVRCSVTAGS